MVYYAPIDPPNQNGRTNAVVDYMYDQDIGNFAYAAGHPMKQHRVRLAHSLIQSYGLYTKMKIFRPKQATKMEMAQFHTEDYVDFLSKVNHENSSAMTKDAMKFNVGDDSPVFDGLFEYCAISAGGSLEGAARLGRKKCDIAVNWAGGLHHAKKSEASGFCYVNDIVLAILELLRWHERVVYIDIDVHHGDGVEEAFFTTDRVMTVSFHQYGEFFPGTGELRDIGADKGKNYSVNFPLRHGIDDASYKGIFEPVMTQVMERYRPGAIVLQCGGDSLAGDRLGSLNLSMRGHANCVNFMKSFGLPLLLLGGGGYTMRNVSRTWAYETGVAVGVDLPPTLPMHEYHEYYGPDYQLDVKAKKDTINQNSPEYLEKIKVKIFENLKETTFAPSVSPLDDVLDSLGMDDEDEDMLDDADEEFVLFPYKYFVFWARSWELKRSANQDGSFVVQSCSYEMPLNSQLLHSRTTTICANSMDSDNPDERHTERRSDQRVEASGELSDSEDENSRSGRRKNGKTRRNEANFRDRAPSDVDEKMESPALPELLSPSESEDEILLEIEAEAELGKDMEVEYQNSKSPSQEPSSRFSATAKAEGSGEVITNARSRAVSVEVKTRLSTPSTPSDS